ncbi:MAG TPA: cytochrome c [Alphaproteobacteria bacterium]|nr:cytochrome c [Alphaproteobacteria bacterium]
MKRKILPLAFLGAAALVSLAVQAKAPTTLKSVDVTLPESTRTLPDGPGVDVVHDNCLACHSAGMILAQPTMPKAAWEAEVNKMRNVFKAPVDAKDVPAIVDYLMAIKGPK